MRLFPERLTKLLSRVPSGSRLVKRLKHPAAVQTLRATVAATIAYVIALRLSREPVPLTAPLTALLVVEVTLYATVKMSIRRINAVVVGVFIAIGFSALVGLSWWSLGLIILASLTIGPFVRANEFVPEVAISAMLVLGVTQVASSAWDRVLETLIGALTGLAFNLFFAPPLWVDTAGDALEDLARRMRRLLLELGDQLDDETPWPLAAERLHEARRLDQDIADVDASLRQAEDSLRLNPRVREGRLHRVVLRTGLDTLEICTVVLRVIARTLTDLAKQREEEWLLDPEVSMAMRDLLGHVADAVVSFAVLVSTGTSSESEVAEDRLVSHLGAANAQREHVARLLLDTVQEDPSHWQLQGALLTEIDRILAELDTEHRSQRLMEELDRNAQQLHERYPALAEVLKWARKHGLRVRRKSA
ncbi:MULTISPECIES: aromatic acid exporter family protein [unclassified Streptomyces]|uniref:FUSC family protein n=1 Tax=unclassified Streptomyces TaxID=2593676 RepID=UPI002258B030|nr:MULTISPECIES: aromatic acid exporter family protein [unclassified Streptomyces]MCX5442379.1 aromatic acid exporter family protein [Streptomyces sp. NBC_00063]WUB91400.1 aromatic acid exporter family protein [Streptomyces sp. NBC_00569]